MLRPGQHTLDPEGNAGPGFDPPSFDRASPNAIERNVMKTIELELFARQRNRCQTNDPISIKQPYDQLDEAALSRAYKPGGPPGIVRRSGIQRLQFLLTGDEMDTARASNNNSNADHAGYMAYSKSKRESQQRNRSCASHVLTALTSRTVKTNLRLQNIDNDAGANLPTLLSPLKLSTIPQRPVS